MFEKYSNSFLKDFELDKILNKFEKKTFHNYSKGDFIYYEKDPILNIYFILSGEIKLIKALDNSNLNHTLRIACSGDIIGLDDALLGNFYTNSSCISEDSNVLAVSKEDFIEITKKNDEFNLWVLKYLSSINVDQDGVS